MVRPRNPDNIGASARAMSNFGFGELSVVSPYEPVWRETCAAVNAEEVIASARLEDSVAEAVKDCHLVLGTTSGQGRSLDREIVKLPGLRDYLAGRFPVRETAKVGILFGPEKTGLTNRHLSHCHAILNIPTSERTPSMNLGQSVALCCYELSALAGSAISPPGPPPPRRPSAGEIETTVALINRAFGKTGYLAGMDAVSRAQRIRKILLDMNLSLNGLYFIRRLLKKILPDSPAPR